MLAAIEPADFYGETSDLFGRERFAPKQSRIGSGRSSRTGSKRCPTVQLRLRALAQTLKTLVETSSKSAKQLGCTVVDELACTDTFAFLRGMSVGSDRY